MGTKNSDSVATEAGLADGSLGRAADSFASLLAEEESDTQEEREQPSEDTERAEAEEPTGDSDESETAIEDAEEADDEEESEQSEDESEEAEEEGEEEPVYTVKVDGKEQEVKLTELKEGYSRQQDYTRKTMALAEERRSFEAEQEAIRQERETYSRLLDRLEEQLNQAETPDWDALYKDDPIEYVRQQQLHQEKQRKLEAAKQEKQRLEEARQKEQYQQLQKLVAEERKALLSALPEWSDPKVAQRDREAIRSYATNHLGFTAQEVDQIVDHRAVVTLKKAMAYDQLQQSRSSLKDKRKPAKQATAKPGSSKRPVTQSSEQKARQRLRKSGSVRDAASVLESLLE